MTARERKSGTKRIAKTIIKLLADIEEKREAYELVTTKFEDFRESANNLEINLESCDIDTTDFTHNLLLGFMNTLGWEDFYEDLTHFENDLNDTISEATESKAEQLEEFYEAILNCTDDLDIDSLESLDDIVDALNNTREAFEGVSE